MGRAARTKTSKAAVKHTLKHARSPEGLVVGIEALGLHEAASDDEDLEAVAASLSSSVDAVAASLATSGLGSGLGSGMDTTHHGRERRPAPGPAPQNPTTLEDEFLEHGVRVVEGDWAAPRRAGARAVGLARLEAAGLAVTAVAFLDPRDAAFTCVVGQGAVPLDALLRDAAIAKAHHGPLAGAHCVDVAALSPPRPPPPVEIGIAPPARQTLADLYGFAYAARPVEASHVDGDVVRRSVSPHVYLRKLARARAFATLLTHAALSAMVSSGDTRIDALVTVAAARRHRRQRRRAREAVRMASKGRCTAASFFRRFVALRRATLVPPPAASASRFPPPPVRAAQPNALDLGRAQAAVLGVAPPATPPPSQRSPDAGPRSAPELPARRRGRLDPGADSRFLTWGDDYSPPQSTR